RLAASPPVGPPCPVDDRKLYRRSPPEFRPRSVGRGSRRTPPDPAATPRPDPPRIPLHPRHASRPEASARSVDEDPEASLEPEPETGNPDAQAARPAAESP